MMIHDWDAHDWEKQRAETVATVLDLCMNQGLEQGVAINLDLHTLAGDDAETPPNRAAYVAALRAAGYTGNAWTSEGDGVETIEITIEGTVLSAEAIWAHEEAVTRIALEHGYRPDGWGFWEP